MGNSQSEGSTSPSSCGCACNRQDPEITLNATKPRAPAPEYATADTAESTDGPPVLVLHHLQTNDLKDVEENFIYFRQRLRCLLHWAAPLSPDRLTIYEFRKGNSPSLVEELMPAGYAYDKCVRVVQNAKGLSGNLGISSPRALVCGGILERVLYPCHDLQNTGSVQQVGIVPQLCGSSGRSGELARAHTISHLEEVLEVVVLLSLKGATEWLVPGAPSPDTPVTMNIKVHSEDNTKLTLEQEQIIALLLPENVVDVSLKKLGKGWSSALKFFCTPTMSKKNAKTEGAMTFIKLGEEKEIEEELNITSFMTQVLGSYCPQVLAYSEIGSTAAIHLSLADLGGCGPQGLADLYSDLVSPTKGLAGTFEGNSMQGRIVGALDFVFGDLARRLHNAKHEEAPKFCIVDELGLTKDLPDGMTGLEDDHNLSSSWVLAKLWKKKPGDGHLASSVRIHITDILGEASADSDMLTFLNGSPLRLPNVRSALRPDALRVLRVASTAHHQLCYVHGDLHGDNIMIDKKDNRFLIDFGKTSVGHCLEDVTWLESFIMLSYTDILNDEEFAETLSLVRALSPPDGLSPAACENSALDAARDGLASMKPLSPRIAAMWNIVKCLRSHLAASIGILASVNGGNREDEMHIASLVACLLLFRNCLFFMGARENKQAPRRRKLALALACAYADTALAMSNGGAKDNSAIAQAPRRHSREAPSYEKSKQRRNSLRGSSAPKT
eukprot:TRINITY_DN14144_c0_g1_i1.p1 TRINITY_DN14144_c0_g1~~TRINITY_DN14144_c0_g1_i1.p1  ORF type:complete len:726 (+),score=162.31 TRINITY_DN14144_c0_g1_i1:98-2275(+)